MNKNVTGIIVVAVVGAGLYFAWRTMTSRKRDALTVLSRGKELQTLLGFDKGYVKNWADAVKKKRPDFTFNGKKYSTETGKTI